MKRIEAVVQAGKLELLRLTLKEMGLDGLVITQVAGDGSYGEARQWRGVQYQVPMPKIKLEVLVPDGRAGKVLHAIAEACRSGAAGAGEIFVSPVSKAVRVSAAKGLQALH